MEVEMGSESHFQIDLHKVPLTFLTFEALRLLSYLLNTTKVILSESRNGLLGMTRDWRGLANLVNVPTDISRSFEQKDKTQKVLGYWVQLGDGTATVGQLLEYMEWIDRFDVFDDFMDLFMRRKLLLTQLDSPSPQLQNDTVLGQLMWNENIMTYDDLRHGAPQTYNAFVLFAKEDEDFALELIDRMVNSRYKICSEKDILPHLTPTLYSTVSRLISSSERCHWVLPIYSPDFLTSPANSFYTSYTQDLAIKSKRARHIPCVYRPCPLPSPISNSLMLYFNSNMYNFWERLEQSLEVPLGDSTERLNDTNSSTNIEEQQSSADLISGHGRSKSWKKIRNQLRKWLDYGRFGRGSESIVSC